MRAWLWFRFLYLRCRAILSRGLDRVLGVHTTVDETTESGQAFNPNKKPTAWLTLWRLFRWLDVGPDDVIVDIGSGAGRAVLVASLFPFGRIIGLEVSSLLHRRAQENLARFRLHGRAPVELTLGDASVYELPDSVTIVFLYNPFAGREFERVMQHVFASVDRRPRPLRLVYVNPKEHAYLAETGRCRLVKRFRGLRPTRRWSQTLTAHIYEVEPSALRRQETAGTPTHRAFEISAAPQVPRRSSTATCPARRALPQILHDRARVR
jgi:precorrin-6B methylase 2